MSLMCTTKSILSLPLLGAVALTVITAPAWENLNNLSLIKPNTDSAASVAYRATGRIDTGNAVAYRASGRFNHDVENTIAYRASGRFEGSIDTMGYRGSERGVEAIAYRASGRFSNGLRESQDNIVAYRGSERGLESGWVG